MKRKAVCFIVGLLIFLISAAAPSAREPALSIDTARVYQGMERSYAEGYLPTVSHGQATVLLPLLSETAEGPLTAAVDLGDPAVSPFVFRNYEKQFNKEAFTFDDMTVEGYLISFSLALSDDRLNGSYPVTFRVGGRTVEGENFSQDFRIYVKISDGIDPYAPGPEPEPAQPPPSQPRLMVESYSLDRQYLKAGESAEVTVTLRNTSSSQQVKNIKLSFIEGSGQILPAGTGAKYCRAIDRGKTYTWSFVVTAAATAQSRPHAATIMMEYEDNRGSAISASDRIILEVRQPVRLEYEEPSLPDRVTHGDTAPFEVTLMNLGKSAIYNALLKFEVPGLSTVGSVLVGTILPGESQTGRANFRVGDDEVGEVSGTLFLSYEDEYGDLYEEEIPLATTIEKKLDTAPPGNTEEEPPAAGLPWWIFAASGAILLPTAYFLLSRWLKQKKAREEDEMRL